MELKSNLEPLALACYACELAGLEAEGVTSEVIESAENGESFEFAFTMPGDLDLQIYFDVQQERFDVAIHLPDAHQQIALVYAALQINHELDSGHRRFSMDMFSGDLVLSDKLAWAEVTPESMALTLCDLIILMDELLEYAQSHEADSEMAAYSQATFQDFAIRG